MFHVEDIVVEKIVELKCFIPYPPKSDKNFGDNKDKYGLTENETMYNYLSTTRSIDEIGEYINGKDQV